MNRKKLKSQARELLRGHVLELITPFVIILFFAILIDWLLIGNLPNPNNASWSLIIDLLLFPLVLGTYALYLNYVRGKKTENHNLFSFYPMIFSVTVLFMLRTIFIFAWGLLLIIPGIIAAISFAMASRIYIDGEKDPMTCIRKSRKMMYGYKFDYFMFLMSFLGWIFLGIMTFGIALIYVIPYIVLGSTLYYEELKKITKF
jgi:uncharacterized membrane protein